MARPLQWLGRRLRAAKRKTPGTRKARFELLERRDLLATAEGSTFPLSTDLSGAGLSGDISAAIDWGDGSSGAGIVFGAGVGPLQARVDYSLDDNNFFDTQAKRDLLEFGARMVISQLGDPLTAITPSDGNSWSMNLLHPATGASGFEIVNPTVAANELVIYAGGREFPESSLGAGGPGGSSVTCATMAFCSDVLTRGQVGAAAEPPTDFGPWGGSLSFNTATNWHFGETTVGLDNDEADFLSVAVHEVAHLLGFGTSPAWNELVSGGFFTGATATAANGGTSVPLAGGHWVDGTISNGQEAALDPLLTNGTRKLLTPLDLAALDDIGWELVDTQLTVTADHVYADDGEYDIDVAVSGSTGGSVSISVSETVTNVDPTVSGPGDGTVLAEQIVTFTDIGQFTDPGFGPAESFSYAIGWGDGSPASTGSPVIDQAGGAGSPTSGSFDATHIFSAAGVYTVSVTVQDDNLGIGVDTFQVTVLEVSWHNSANAFDVNGDSAVSALDALVVINELNVNGPRLLPTPTTSSIPPFLDVSDDGSLSPLDALQVINFINDQMPSPEGEAAFLPADPRAITSRLTPSNSRRGGAGMTHAQSHLALREGNATFAKRKATMAKLFLSRPLARERTPIADKQDDPISLESQLAGKIDRVIDELFMRAADGD